MAEKVSAKKFFNDFSSVKNDPEAIKEYQDNKGFTTFITDKIQDIIKSYDLKAEKEYYRIDVIGYKSHFDAIENKKDIYISPYAWDLKIAVEHENDDRLWMDEVVKLAHICCDLRVVIGYLPMDEREKKGADEKSLEYIVDVMKKHCKCFCNLKNKNNEFMVIIGNSRTKKIKNYFYYKGYLFNPETERFEKI